MRGGRAGRLARRPGRKGTTPPAGRPTRSPFASQRARDEPRRPAWAAAFALGHQVKAGGRAGRRGSEKVGGLREGCAQEPRAKGSLSLRGGRVLLSPRCTVERAFSPLFRPVGPSEALFFSPSLSAAWSWSAPSLSASLPGGLLNSVAAAAAASPLQALWGEGRRLQFGAGAPLAPTPTPWALAGGPGTPLLFAKSGAP